MRHRSVVVGLLLVVITLGMATRVPAQSQVRRVIDVTLSEFKFEPNQISFNEGETVVIRMRNAGPRFSHNIAARYWANIPLTVRGDGRQGIDEERKWVLVDAGKSAEVEFVAQGRGSAAFICSLFTHAIAGMAGAYFIAPAPR